MVSFHRLSFHEVTRLLANFRTYYAAGSQSLRRIPVGGVGAFATTKDLLAREKKGRKFILLYG